MLLYWQKLYHIRPRVVKDKTVYGSPRASDLSAEAQGAKAEASDFA